MDTHTHTHTYTHTHIHISFFSKFERILDQGDWVVIIRTGILSSEKHTEGSYLKRLSQWDSLFLKDFTGLMFIGLK